MIHVLKNKSYPITIYVQLIHLRRSTHNHNIIFVKNRHQKDFKDYSTSFSSPHPEQRQSHHSFSVIIAIFKWFRKTIAWSMKNFARITKAYFIDQNHACIQRTRVYIYIDTYVPLCSHIYILVSYVKTCITKSNKQPYGTYWHPTLSRILVSTVARSQMMTWHNDLNISQWFQKFQE